MTTKLFRIITSRDEIIVADPRNPALDAGSIARELVAKGSMELMLYGVRHAKDGLEYAPLRPVAVLAQETFRVEPYDSALPVAAH